MRTLNNRDIVPMMRAAADVHNNAKELVEPIRVVHFIDGIEQTQLKGKGNAIGELDVFSQIFLVLEAF